VSGTRGIHILAKPVGPLCNLNCKYCFYTEKVAMYAEKKDFRMADNVLETYIHKYISSQSVPEVSFVWQGGEPTLLGLEFFQRVVELQQKYSGGKKIVNSLQTNGTLLDEHWGKFLKTNDFLVGLSLDGPESVHDRYRLTRSGQPTFDKVMQSLTILQEYEIPVNVLSCVTKESAYKPLEIYHFFKEHGVDFIQFIPIVERQADEAAKKLGLRLATPASLNSDKKMGVTAWSVEPEVYGDFLITIFDEWVKNDVGSIHIMNFEWALTAWLGLPATVCVFAEQCGESVVMEHDGGVFSCDHYVYPQYCLGSILTSDPYAMVDSEKQCQFSKNKGVVPQYCQTCEVEFACHGECPKHRFGMTPDGQIGLNYLCAGYKKYFRHIHPYMKVMCQLIENDLSAAKIMDVIKGPLVVKRTK